jgi:HEAT repeat protein
MDPTITDQEEKEAAAQGVVAAGEVALEPIREFCAKAESLTWPLKILKQIVTEEHYADELLDILEEFDTEYVRNAEPKRQLITALADFPSEDVREAVEPFLQDMSEPVRFAAVSTLFAVADAASTPALVEAMADEESLRVRNRIALGLSERDWKISSDLSEKCRTALPTEFALVNDLVRRK